MHMLNPTANLSPGWKKLFLSHVLRDAQNQLLPTRDKGFGMLRERKSETTVSLENPTDPQVRAPPKVTAAPPSRSTLGNGRLEIPWGATLTNSKRGCYDDEEELRPREFRTKWRGQERRCTVVRVRSQMAGRGEERTGVGWSAARRSHTTLHASRRRRSWLAGPRSQHRAALSRSSRVSSAPGASLRRADKRWPRRRRRRCTLPPPSLPPALATAAADIHLRRSASEGWRHD